MEVRDYVKGGVLSDSAKSLIRDMKSVLIRIFGKYASFSRSHNLNVEEWVAMAMDLIDAATTHNHSIWSNGGRPTKRDMMQCFTLSKRMERLQEEEITFTEFQRCIVYFVGRIFPNQPNTRYSILGFDVKLKMMQKWIRTLDAKKWVISSERLIQSDTYWSNMHKKAMKESSMYPSTEPEWMSFSGTSSLGLSSSSDSDLYGCDAGCNVLDD